MSTENVPPSEDQARDAMPRRVLLIAGGLTLLAGCTAAVPGQVASAAPLKPPPSHSRTRLASKAKAKAKAKDKERRRRVKRHVPDKDPMYYVDDGPKGIALTIDDGPNPVYTPQVLRLLEKYRVNATFSMIGMEVDTYPGVAREVAAAGHVIANHTWSHPDLAIMAPSAVADQMNRATAAIHKETGRVPTLFRAPYGAWSQAVMSQCARSGMTPVDWSVDPRDWSLPGTASIVSNIMANTRTGSIILEHDGGGDRSETVAALKIVLPRLLAAGYHFTIP